MAAASLKPADRASLERFVRDTLGCTCPDAVFESIVIQHDDAAVPLRHTRLVVGERLLIYLLEGPAGRVAPADVARLAGRGLAERNERGFNRFRLVVEWDRPVQEPGEFVASFSSVAGRDDRAHLHVIPAGQLPDVLRHP